MREPIDRDAVRSIVRDYYPGADPVDVEYVVRRAAGAAEIVLYDAIREGRAGDGLALTGTSYIFREGKDEGYGGAGDTGTARAGA